MHRCLTSQARCHLLTSSRSLIQARTIIPSTLFTISNNSSLQVDTFTNNHHVRSMAWSRSKKPKSKQVREKLAADFPMSKRLDHFFMYKEEGRLPTMHFELYKEFLFYCVMEAIADPQSCDKAFEIARAAEQLAGHKLDIEAYTYLIQVCALNRKIDDVESLWKEMDEKQVAKDNQQVYGAILRAYCLVDNEARCKELFAEMLQKGLMPKFVTFERIYRNLKYL